MRDAVSIYERCCFEIWEVLFRDMGGADQVGKRRGHEAFPTRIGGLVVSVSACGSSDPSSSLTRCTIFGSTSVNHETFRDIRSACREGGIQGYCRGITNNSEICQLLSILNISYVYSFLAVTFPSISQKLPSSLNSAVLLLNAKKFQITLLLDTSGIQQHDEHRTNVSLTVHISVCPSPSAYFSSNHFFSPFFTLSTYSLLSFPLPSLYSVLVF